MGPFVFFDLGQTLIDEWKYVKYFDNLLFNTLNGFGARIDLDNYITLRNNIIQNRKIGFSGFLSIVSSMAQLILPKGYDVIIYNLLEANLLANKKKLVKLMTESDKIIPILSQNYSLGIISNNSSGSVNLLVKKNLKKYFNIICLSQDLNFKKPDVRIFKKALDESGCRTDKCIMIGDRLDLDIFPANELGMKTIRTLNSLYKIQKPLNSSEKPLYTIKSLYELPDLLSKIF